MDLRKRPEKNDTGASNSEFALNSTASADGVPVPDDVVELMKKATWPTPKMAHPLYDSLVKNPKVVMKTKKIVQLIDHVTPKIREDAVNGKLEQLDSGGHEADRDEGDADQSKPEK